MKLNTEPDAIMEETGKIFEIFQKYPNPTANHLIVLRELARIADEYYHTQKVTPNARFCKMLALLKLENGLQYTELFDILEFVYVDCEYVAEAYRMVLDNYEMLTKNAYNLTEYKEEVYGHISE